MACGPFLGCAFCFKHFLLFVPQTSSPRHPWPFYLLHYTPPQPKSPRAGSEAKLRKEEGGQCGVEENGSVPGVWHSQEAGTSSPGSLDTLGERSVLSAWILGKSLKVGRGPPRCSPALNHCTGHRWSPAPPAHQTARSALAALPDACGARAVRTGFLAPPLGDAQYVGPAPRRPHQ